MSQDVKLSAESDSQPVPVPPAEPVPAVPLDEAITPPVLPTPEEVEATPLPPEPAARPAGPSRRPMLRRLARLRTVLEWAWVPVVFPFVILLLMTVLPRFTVPFELEWMEGHSAEQAWRFTEGLPLYPKPEQNWVPYMYTPLYHMLFGGLMELSGRWTLAWGRLISLLSTFATMAAILMIVHDRTRRLAPSLFAACLYAAYFKPTGYWYDIVRVDAMAFALAIWGTYLTTKRRVTFWQGFWGIVLLLLGTLTKQSVGLIGVACAPILLVKNLRAAVAGGLASIFLLVNFGYLMDRGGNDRFFHYVVTNTLEHPSNPAVYMPGGQHPDALWIEVAKAEAASNPAAKPGAELPDPGFRALATGYVERWKSAGPPMLWKECLRHCWLLLALIVPWALLSFVRFRRMRGFLFFPPAVLFIYGACKSYALFGGFMNNFLPLFLAVCVLAGLSMDGIRRNLRGVWRIGAMAAMTVVLVLQIFQPWNLPNPDDGAAHWNAWKAEPDAQRRASAERLVEHRRRQAAAEREKRLFTESAPDVPFSHWLAWQAGRWNSAGLGWFPSHQQPHPRAREAHKALMDWLTWKAKSKESVWVMHHQWFGILAGHPLGANVDAIRCALWAGNPFPATFRTDIESGRYDWLILDNLLEYDWQADRSGTMIGQKYDYIGTVPGLDQIGPEALRPVTGAEVKPFTLFRRKGFTGAVRPAE